MHLTCPQSPTAAAGEPLSWAASSAGVRWLPTGCLALLDTLHTARPAHMLLAADFDALPGVRVAGAGAPLVAGKVRVIASKDLTAGNGWEDSGFNALIKLHHIKYLLLCCA